MDRHGSNLNCKPRSDVTAEVTARLYEAAPRVSRSFHLQTAACVPDAGDPRPHHGPGPCTYQMAELQAYGRNLAPMALVAHGRDDKIDLCLVRRPGEKHGPTLEAAILQGTGGDASGTTKP